MNENHDRQRIHDALNRTLAPVAGDPQLEQRLLHRLQEDAQPTPRRLRPAKLLLIPALLLLLLTGAFAAERLGLFDMLLHRHEGGVLPEAEQLVDVPATLHATQSEHATLTVVQSLRTGGDVVLLIEAAPTAEGVLLAPDALLGTLADNSACRAMMGFEPEAGDAILTHAENAGRQLIVLDVRLSCPGDATLEYTILDGELLSDGSMRLLLYAHDDALSGSEALTLQLNWATTPVLRSLPAPDGALQTLWSLDSPQRSAAYMTLAVPAAPQATALAASLPPLTAPEAALPIEVPEAGIRIDGVTLVRTPLYTRFEVSYTCLFDREERAEREVFFFLSDEEGRWLTDGVRGGSIAHGTWPVITRVGYASALPDAMEEIWLTVMTFNSNVPLAHVRVPLTTLDAPEGVPALPTPAP